MTILSTDIATSISMHVAKSSSLHVATSISMHVATSISMHVATSHQYACCHIPSVCMLPHPISMHVATSISMHVATSHQYACCHIYQYACCHIPSVFMMPHLAVCMFPLSGAFAKLRKMSIISVMYIRPHRITSAVSGRGFMKFVILAFFENLLRKFECHCNMTKKTVTLRAARYTFMTLSC